MITLNDVDNYMLEDGQGACFGGGRIFESLQEVKEQFAEWANMDEYESDVLNEWTIVFCLDNWTMTLWKYDGAKWNEVDNEKELNFMSDNKII
jgi:hypothetical protein